MNRPNELIRKVVITILSHFLYVVECFVYLLICTLEVHVDNKTGREISLRKT